MNDAAVHDFLQRHGLSVDSVDVGGLVDGFLAEMELGLAGRPASLAMLPTYLSADRPIPANTPVLVLDAGGTNLRVARIVFDQAAKPTFSDMTRVRMPGSDREVDKETT